jgi:cytidine deaminase
MFFYGCNVEHQFRSHDVHAEVNAITTMVAAGQKQISAILIVAERTRFTPCGACMDWVFQFGYGTCLVGFQQQQGGTVEVYRADELMPHYPV